jgi:hypothetical protein
VGGYVEAMVQFPEVVGVLVVLFDKACSAVVVLLSGAAAEVVFETEYGTEVVELIGTVALVAMLDRVGLITENTILWYVPPLLSSPVTYTT